MKWERIGWYTDGRIVSTSSNVQPLVRPAMGKGIDQNVEVAVRREQRKSLDDGRGDEVEIFSIGIVRYARDMVQAVRAGPESTPKGSAKPNSGPTWLSRDVRSILVNRTL